jgi:hypothetical protein
MWTEHTGGITARQAFLNSYNRTGTFWNNTVHDPGVVNQYQSSTVYQRGAQTLQALRMKIGDERFFNTLRAYHSTFKGSVAETQDFIAIAQRESGQDLRDFFKAWLYTPGKPSESYCFCVGPATGSGGVSGTVPATLALTLDGPATFGAFTPGVEKEYTATTKATVTSSAADATLSVAEPGHMTNGAFSLPEPLRIEFSKSAWTGPVSNDEVAVTAKQLVKAKDALRTGSYSKTVTFTLSTTSP